MIPASLVSLSDEDLIARCRARESAAWGVLVDRYRHYVWAIIIRAYRLPEADAEDVFQEVFTRAYQKLAELRSDGAVRPWLAQMTRFASIDRLRAGAREQPRDEILLDEADVDSVLDRIDEALTVRHALTHLPEHCQDMLDRFFTRDQSYEAIGRELAIPAGTIASRISRCLGKLRVTLAEVN